jgi:hypothetical protein
VRGERGGGEEEAKTNLTKPCVRCNIAMRRYRVEGSVNSAAISGDRVLACSGLFHRGSNDQYLGTSGAPGVNPTDCFAYEPTQRVWTRVSSLLHGVDHAAVGVDPNGGAAGRVYVFGGRDIGRNIGARGIDLTQVRSATHRIAALHDALLRFIALRCVGRHADSPRAHLPCHPLLISAVPFVCGSAHSLKPLRFG